MLGCERLTLGYPGKRLCRELDLAVAPGQCWAVLGQNGSGKTTLLHALAGLVAPQGGAVLLHGRGLASYGRRELARRLGVLAQHEEHGFQGSVLEYALLGRYPHARSPFGWQAQDEEAVRQCLEQMELGGLAARPFATLSGGERQRARIAQLLVQAPRVYLLDEPLQHLDLRHQRHAMGLFRELAEKDGCAVMMVLHDPRWAARHCSHALLLYEDGRILGGAADALLVRENLEALYQCELESVALYERGSSE